MKIPNLKVENRYCQKGLIVCGLDEVGRGSLAGPVVAAAYLMKEKSPVIVGVRDSKKLNPKTREKIYFELLESSFDFGIGLVPAKRIDHIGIGEATKEAMLLSLDQLAIKPDQLIIDAVSLQNCNIPQTSLVRADEECYSVASASIIAKVYRDRLMCGLANVHPQYYFNEHKGYGTKKHFLSLSLYGLTEEHRRSFLSGYLKGEL